MMDDMYDVRGVREEIVVSVEAENNELALNAATGAIADRVDGLDPEVLQEEYTLDWEETSDGLYAVSAMKRHE